MTLVIDSSVAIKWFVVEPLHQEAVAMLDAEDQMIAPSIILAEVANGLWRKVRLGEAQPRQALAAIEELETSLVLRPIDSALTMAAFEIAQRVGHSIYDCLFLACAAAERTALVTADARFASKVASDELNGSIRLLEA